MELYSSNRDLYR